MEWLQALGSCRHHPAAISSAIPSQKQHEMFPNGENCTVLYKIMGSTMFLLWVSWHRKHQETIPWPRCHRGSELFFTSLGDEWLGPIPWNTAALASTNWKNPSSLHVLCLAKARVYLLHPSSSLEVYIIYIYILVIQIQPANWIRNHFQNGWLNRCSVLYHKSSRRLTSTTWGWSLKS